MSKHEKRGVRRVKMRAHELTDAEVSFVSLVGKAASRMPVRILKKDTPQEKQMIDLASMFTRTRKSEGPKLVALVVNPGAENKDSVLKFLGEQGYATEDQTEHEGTLLLKQDAFELDEENLVSVKLDNDVGALVRVDKRFDPTFASADFNENLASQTFFPSISMATEALFDTVRGVMEQASDNAALQSGLGEAIDAYRDFVLNMAASMPETLFKFDSTVSPKLRAHLNELAAEAPAAESAEEVTEAAAEEEASAEAPEATDAEAPAEEAKDEETSPEATAEAESTTDAPAAETEDSPEASADVEAPEAELPEGEQEVRKAAMADDGVPAPEATTESDEGAEPETESVQKSDAPDANQLMAGFKSMLDESLAPLNDRLSELDERIEKSEKRSEDIQKRVFGTVTVDDVDDEAGVRNGKVRKSDDVWAGTGLDRLV